MTDKMMHEALQAAISLYGGNTALGRLVRERGAVGVFEIAFEYGWRALKPKAQEGKDADAPTPWRLSKCETMDEAKGEVLPDQAGGIRVEWIKGQPCFIGFGDAHAINTLIASIRDQKMDVEKAAINSDCVTEAIVKPRNPREPESTDPVIGWLKEIGDKLYHAITRQEEIGIVQCRMMNEVLDLLRKEVEVTGCADLGVVNLDDALNEAAGTFGGEFAKRMRKSYENEGIMRSGVDLATGPDCTAYTVVEADHEAPCKFTPLEMVSDEVLDHIKEQLPVSVYVAEMARRKQVQNVVKDERDVKIEELQAKASTLEKRLHFYRLLAKSRAAALNAVYGELDSFEA